MNDGKETISADDLKTLTQLMNSFVFDVFGLKQETANTAANKALDEAMKIILEMRRETKERKDYAASDRLRNQLAAANITIKDTKDGATWNIQE